jgi:hypothetical protein
MFAPIHHELEGIAADRLRSLASQFRRMQEQGAQIDLQLCAQAVRDLKCNPINGTTPITLAERFQRHSEVEISLAVWLRVC